MLMTVMMAGIRSSVVLQVDRNHHTE